MCIHVSESYIYFRRFVGKIFGSRATNCVLGVERYCCERPNPTLQVCTYIYLLLFPTYINSLLICLLEEKSSVNCFMTVSVDCFPLSKDIGTGVALVYTALCSILN